MGYLQAASVYTPKLHPDTFLPVLVIFLMVKLPVIFRFSALMVTVWLGVSLDSVTVQVVSPLAS